MLDIDKSGAAWVLAPSTIAKASSANFAFAGNFTIEVFAAVFADLANSSIVSNYNSWQNNRSWFLNYTGTNLRFFGSTDGSALVGPDYAWSPSLATPYDIAVDRSGSTVRLYVDGSMVASATLSGALFQPDLTYAPGLTIGQIYTGSAPSFTSLWTGKAKALRITDGTARYATDGSYTVPSLPLPAAA